MRQRISCALLAAVAVLVFAGCGPKPAEAPTPPAASAEVVTPMTIAEKRELIAPNFLAEVPVPMGHVVRGESQGDTAWDYELIVGAPPAALAEWYKSAYVGREWEVVGQTAPSPGTLVLTLTKNAAETRATITPETAGRSRVRAVLGVGTPVLQTQ